MRETNRQDVARAQEELSRLKLEGQQIEQAIARRGRGNARSSRVTNEQVFAAAQQVESPFNPLEVQQLLAAQGIAASGNTIRNHLKRLVAAKQLDRLDDGTYVVKHAVPGGSDEFTSSPTDDDIPF